MKIRNRKITVRLSEKERKFLGEQADAGGMKIEPYIRELIMGNEVKSRPKEEWALVALAAAAWAAITERKALKPLVMKRVL